MILRTNTSLSVHSSHVAAANTYAFDGELDVDVNALMRTTPPGMYLSTTVLKSPPMPL